jgi:uncharacterized protein YkwD
MRRRPVSVCVVALLAAIAAPWASARPTARSQAALSSRETALVVAINAVRTLHLLPKLQVDFRLERAARSHSRDMLRHHYFAHGNFASRMYAFHIRGTLFAENLYWASGVSSPNATVASWLASPPHRQNLLDGQLRRIGVATPLGSFGGFSTATMVTADFAG